MGSGRGFWGGEGARRTYVWSSWDSQHVRSRATPARRCKYIHRACFVYVCVCVCVCREEPGRRKNGTTCMKRERAMLCLQSAGRAWGEGTMSSELGNSTTPR